MNDPSIFASPRDLLTAEGTQLGPTPWMLIDQQRIDRFADATDDRQWIHVDRERAATGPFGRTIAHGYLTLSLANAFLPQLVEVRGFSHGVNVGTDRTRFLAPVPEGSRIRGVGEIVKVEEVKGAIQSIVRITIELEGSDKPACVVDTISRYYPED
ncbi:MaoC family dehydratase [Sphingomonas sanxanigenens]|uniref:MaoC family dehydratase n=1 Tax=Sphingomonas sanxanigenens DSM 19645 = NX02 TaxID=1123269 RepID=W0AG60_9SPHN|nr:MaoC family dehydratase [Sphingomonas sanxanigenens]AHE54645.1 MaoC family dehydratase [Sphingomonas sanxanigenens DSM 19645 = NX02]